MTSFRAGHLERPGALRSLLGRTRERPRPVPIAQPRPLEVERAVRDHLYGSAPREVVEVRPRSAAGRRGPGAG